MHHQGGAMRRTRRKNWKLVKTLALSFAAAAVFTGSASAHVRDDAASQRGSEVSYQPDGYQPQLRGDEPLIIRNAPDGFQPQTRGVEVATVSATSDGFAWEDAA